jgi:glycosyltransferase involved in cell wall biosynthesis
MKTEATPRAVTSSPPLISVIVPTFNRLALLKETVESVRRQTFRDFELIVVNDGSSDGTKEWLDGCGDIRAIHRANGGIASARNAGAAAARGEWFAFLDHDDLWGPRKLETQALYVTRNPEVGLAAVKHVKFGALKEERRPGRWVKGDLFREVFSKSVIHTSTVMIRRDVFFSVGGFPVHYRFADEFDVWLKIARDHPIALYDGPLVQIRLYEANTSHNRIGVRTDTRRILLSNYDPLRIPRKMFLKTMADHDISFGRAYMRLGRLPEALSWFRASIRRAPWRLRGYRYWLRCRVTAAIHGRDVSPEMREPQLTPSFPYRRLRLDAFAHEPLGCSREEAPAMVASLLREHGRILREGGPAVKKNAPESAVTVVSLPDGRSFAVKELKPRGVLHGLKGLFRPTQGLRGYRNADRLDQEGVGVARAPVLASTDRLGVSLTEWLVMETIPGATEWDRYVDRRFDEGWTADERRLFVTRFGAFIGNLHARGIFHSDLKTCNILTVPSESGPCFYLMDYDDVRFRAGPSLRRRVKNLTQLFLSSPRRFGPVDRMRFLRAYGAASGLSGREGRELARRVLDRARGRRILYVGVHGDVEEDWEG